MKKNLLLVLFTIAAICVGQKAQAQAKLTKTTATAVTVSIDITEPVLSIVLDATNAVQFTYSTPEEYAADKVEPKANHLTVISNQPYSIKVKATDEFTSTTQGSTAHPALSVVSVDVVQPAGYDGTYSQVEGLTTADQLLVTDAPATATQKFNVNYTIKKSKAQQLAELPLEKYETTVTYTATQL